MAKGGAKIASKNDPRARNKGQVQKVVDGKAVKPAKFIYRQEGLSYMGGCFENGDFVTDESGRIKKWGEI